ncbi:hypothetical protein FTRO_0020030 [Fructobacillus tropaeoli]|uniref:Uncharacterized protein n=1 Tax=Fructobacillus tropaeoli TaxID=709323 RepID=A0A3F3H186_9LACO|nr:hypothetical protein FTRO_0020030 [Fructobacillus tropaeoli]
MNIIWLDGLDGGWTNASCNFKISIAYAMKLSNLTVVYDMTYYY